MQYINFISFFQILAETSSGVKRSAEPLPGTSKHAKKDNNPSLIKKSVVQNNSSAQSSNSENTDSNVLNFEQNNVENFPLVMSQPQEINNSNGDIVPSFEDKMFHFFGRNQSLQMANNEITRQSLEILKDYISKKKE